MTTSRSRESGFTLLEVMVALAVIATAFTALLSLHVRNLETIARENAFSRSLLLAETLAAEAELEGYPDLGTSRGDFATKLSGEAAGFTWERNVREWMLPGTREITIRVVPPRGDESASELTLFVSKDLR
jgi:general secretion pathway protein I